MAKKDKKEMSEEIKEEAPEEEPVPEPEFKTVNTARGIMKRLPDGSLVPL